DRRGRHGLDDLLLGLLQLAVVLAVAQHAEVARHAVVGVDGDAGEDFLTLVEAEPLHAEVREPDPGAGVRRILAIVGGARLREALEVLGDLARVGHALQPSPARPSSPRPGPASRPVPGTPRGPVAPPTSAAQRPSGGPEAAEPPRGAAAPPPLRPSVP